MSAPPPPTGFTIDDVNQFISRRIPQPEFAQLVTQYCSPQVNEGDGVFIRQFPAILNRAVMTLIKQIESNAKKAGENRLAFLYRRKATMLQFCLDKGIEETFAMFDKPKSFLSFLKALGPPPDATEPFYDHLMQHFRAGDSVFTLDTPQGLDLMVVESSKPPEAEYDALKSRLAARKITDWNSIDGILKEEELRIRAISDFVQANGVKYLLNWLNSKLFPDQVKIMADAIFAAKFFSKSVGELLNDKLREILLPELSDPTSMVDSNHLAVFELFMLLANVKRYGHVKSTLIEMEALAKQVEETCKSKPLVESMQWIENLTQGLANNIDAQIPLEYQRERIIFDAFNQPKGDEPGTDGASPISFPSLNDFATSATFYRTKSLQLFAVSLIHRCLRETMAIEQSRAAAQARKGL